MKVAEKDNWLAVFKVLATDEKCGDGRDQAALLQRKKQPSITLSLHRNPSCYDLWKWIRARAQL